MTARMPLLRSQLYVPASNGRFIAKAPYTDADAIILDLEDGVAPNEKHRARELMSDAVKQVGAKGAVVLVRINNTGDFKLEDTAAAARSGAYAIIVPKASVPDLVTLSAHCDMLEAAVSRAPMKFLALVEDPEAVLDARAIAASSPRVFAMACGGEDLATGMDAKPTPEVLRLPKLLVHLAAKSRRILSFGMLKTVAEFRDADGIRRAALEAASFGFDGASCVHPSIVPILNDAFSPSEAEAEEARKIVDAFENETESGRGAFSFEGRMVDRPVVDRARRLLAKYQLTRIASGASG